MIAAIETGPFADPPYVIVELGRTAPPVSWPPCPVLGIGDSSHPDAARCDVVVPDEAACAGLRKTIARAPIAAMTLVQTLRATETLSAEVALTVESLAYAAVQRGPDFLAWHGAQPRRAAAPPEENPVRLRRRGAVLSLRLNAPAKHNAVGAAMRDALHEALTLPASDETIRRIVLQGEGRCFSVGGALDEFGLAPDPATAHAVRSVRSPAFALARVAPRAVARVHGACIGAGAELASLCGRVIAAPGSFFQLPEIRYGLIPGSGGTVGFARRIGRQRTAYLALSGRRLPARLALAWGLVDRLSA